MTPPGLAAVAVAAVVLGVLGRSTSAAFTATTRTSANSWATGTLVQRYVREVLADQPFLYHRVEETTGTVAADTPGHHRSGSYAGTIALQQAGALPANPGSAVALGGSGARIVGGGTALSDPTTFSLELWFRTTSATGGKLMGFESTQGATSPRFDRHVFMNAAGQLVYGGWSNPNDSRITTTSSYNDGNWHHLVVTARAHGALQASTIYIDGHPVATGTTTKTGSYSGWWRVGAESLPTGPGCPSGELQVTVDEVAVYLSELSAARVADHFTAR